jgi:hypothetical protein
MKLDSCLEVSTYETSQTIIPNSAQEVQKEP